APPYELSCDSSRYLHPRGLEDNNRRQKANEAEPQWPNSQSARHFSVRQGLNPRASLQFIKIELPLARVPSRLLRKCTLSGCSIDAHPFRTWVLAISLVSDTR